MRLGHSLIVIPALALVMLGCAPHRHPHGPGMHMRGGCGPEACSYRGDCFSPGAIQSNAGACQACSGGNWVPANGCSEHGHCDHCDHCHGCDGKKGKKSGPCEHGGGKGGPHHKR